MKSISKKVVIVALIILFLELAFLGGEYYIKSLEYNKIGSQYISMLNTDLIAKLICMTISGILIFIITLILNLVITKNLKKFQKDDEKIKNIRFPTFSSAFAIAVITSFFVKDLIYDRIMILFNSTSFFVNDPIFYKDIGYYIFQLPFWEGIQECVLGFWLGITMYTVIYYVAALGFLFDQVDIENVKKYGIFNHIFAMAYIFLLLQIPNALISMQGLLYSENSGLIGANYTDIYIWLNWYRAVPFVLAIILTISYIFLLKGKYKKAGIAISTFAGYVLLGFLGGIFTNVFLVNPSSIDKEKPFVQNNINYTKMAYNISSNMDYNIKPKVQERDFYVTDSLSQAMLSSNNAILSNVLKESELTQEQKNRYLEQTSILNIEQTVLKKAELAFPFLHIDTKPKLIVTDKDTIWCVDGYTYSNKFPYSQYTKIINKMEKPKETTDINYMRNSVKILVNTQNGTVKGYIIDNNDPIILTYQKTYPDIFETESMPTEILEKISYPEYFFKIQAGMLEKYHTSDAETFISGTDIWNIAKQKTSVESKTMEPNSTMKKFPNSYVLEPTLSLPFTLSGKTNMSAILYARCDETNYGMMEIYKFPRSLSVYSPIQVDSHISSDENTLALFDTWTKAGLKITRGSMTIIPLEYGSFGTLLYIEPVYVSSDSRNIENSELKKIIIGYQGKVVIEDTLESALKKVLELAGAIEMINPDTSNQDELYEQAIQIYLKAKWYLNYGDLTNYGITMKEFDKMVEKILANNGTTTQDETTTNLE